MNRERGRVASADRVRLNQFTDNLYDEVNLSGEIAQEKARRKLHRLQARVNGGFWLQGLHVSGVCRKCGARQHWAPALLTEAISLCVTRWRLRRPADPACTPYIEERFPED